MDRKPDDTRDLDVMELVESEDPEAGAASSEFAEDEDPKTTATPVEIKLLSFDEGSKSKRSGGIFSKGCLFIGCGLGAALLIGVFSAGYSSLKQSVWVGFDASCKRVATGLPFEMTAGRRERLKADMSALAEELQAMDDPYETMGKFTSEVNLSFRDGLLRMSEVERIESILDEILRSEASPD
jgi:hypothetical protein